jgi:hypothetical protein
MFFVIAFHTAQRALVGPGSLCASYNKGKERRERDKMELFHDESRRELIQ